MVHLLTDEDIEPYVPKLNDPVEVVAEGGISISGRYLGHHAMGGIMFVGQVGVKPWGIDINKIVAIRAGSSFESDE